MAHFTTQNDIDVAVDESGVLAIDGYTVTLSHHDLGRLAAALHEAARRRRAGLMHGRLELHDFERFGDEVAP